MQSQASSTEKILLHEFVYQTPPLLVEVYPEGIATHKRKRQKDRARSRGDPGPEV